MKILTLVQRYFPAIGGTETQAKMVAEELVKRGHEVTIFTTNSVSSLDIPSLTHSSEKSTLSANEFINGVKIIRNKPILRIFGFIFIKPEVNLLKYDFDIIHSNGFYVLYSLIGAMLAFLRRKKHVHTPHDATIALTSSGLKRAFSFIHNLTIGKYINHNSIKIIAVSDENRKDIISTGINKDKIIVIPNPIDLSKFRSNIIRTNGCNDLLFVGRITESKGIQYLIKSMALLKNEFPDLSLTIIGPDWGYRNHLEKLVEGSNLKDSIIFKGKVSEQELIQHYTEADIFVLPSTLEAFGIVLIEAMAAGLPVIASDHGGISNIIQHKENGLLFEPENVLDLSSMLKLIMENPILRKNISSNGLKSVQQYNVHEIVTMIESIYFES